MNLMAFLLTLPKKLGNFLRHYSIQVENIILYVTKEFTVDTT